MRNAFTARAERRRHRSEPRPEVVLEVNGVHHPVEPPGLVIGREIDADLCLDDKGVSRRHARIWVLDRAYGRTVTIVDLDSTNGVIVNGERVQQAPLEDGGVVKIGHASMTVRVLASGEDEPNGSAEDLDKASPSSRQHPPQTAEQHGQWALFWKVLLSCLPILPFAAYYAGTMVDDTASTLSNPQVASPQTSSAATSAEPGVRPAARSWLTQTPSKARSFADWSTSEEENAASPAIQKSSKRERIGSSRSTLTETTSLTPADNGMPEDPSGPAPENPGGPAPENPGGPAPNDPSLPAPNNPGLPALEDATGPAAEDPSAPEEQPKSGQEGVVTLLESLLQATVLTDPQG